MPIRIVLCVFFFARTSSRISEWPWLGYACDPIPVTFRLSRAQLQTLTGQRENILSHPLFSRLLMYFWLLLVSLFNFPPINHSFIALASTLNFAQHYFMDLALLVVEGRGGRKQPPCMCWTFEKVCLLPKIAGHSRGSSYLGTKRPSVFPNVGTLNFCSAALLYTFTSTHCRLNTNRTFVKSFFCSKMIPPALKRLLRGICICSGDRQNELDYMCKIYCRPMNWTHKSVWERYLI